MTAGLSPKYDNVYKCVDRIPRTATEIYRRWADLPDWKALTRRHRNERKWLAGVLVNLAAEQYISREVIREDGLEYVAFRRVETDDTTPAEPRGAAHSSGDQ